MKSSPSSRSPIASGSGVVFYHEFSCLVAETSVAKKVMSLGMFSKKVVLNPSTKSITIYKRNFWMPSEPIHIEFDWIAAILFDDKIYEANQYSYSTRGLAAFNCTTYDYETIAVRIALKDGRVYKTFKLGAGSSTNDLSAFLSANLGNPYANQIAGQDSSHSLGLLYAQALAQVTGVPISKSLNI